MDKSLLEQKAQAPDSSLAASVWTEHRTEVIGGVIAVAGITATLLPSYRIGRDAGYGDDSADYLGAMLSPD